MITNGGNKRNESAAVFTSVVLLVTFGLILTMLLINSGVAKTAEQAAALRATFAPTLVPPSPTVVPTTVMPTTAPAAGAASLDPQQVAAGKSVFDTTCFACHGMNAKGIPGLGKDLVDSSFVHSLSDQELVEFIDKGRPATDPANTTGIAMPARGGNPALTDAQLADVAVYLRSLAPQSGGAAPAQPAPAQPTTAAEQAETTPFVLPIYAVLTPAGDATEAAAPAVEATAVPSTTPTLRPTPVETEAAFALPIDSVLTPSGS